MKVNVGELAVAGLPCASLPAWAGPKEITQCQTISGPGSYVLAGNLPPGFLGQCLVIATSNVTIDLGGFLIIGHGDAIITAVSPLHGITVKNGTIETADGAAVDLKGADGSQVTGLNITVGGAGTGIAAMGIVKGNTLQGGAGNVGISGSGVIEDNYVTGMGIGIEVNCPSTVVHNAVTNNRINLVLNGSGCVNNDNAAP